MILKERKENCVGIGNSKYEINYFAIFYAVFWVSSELPFLGISVFNVIGWIPDTINA